MTAADPPALDCFLSYRLHQVAKLTDRASGDAYAAEFGLPVGEARCLAAIGHFDAVSVVELAARANLHKGPASRSAQALVERGLATKEANEADGRGVLLQLTPAGRRLWTRVMDLIARRNDEMFGCLSSAERKQLGAMLDRLIAHAGNRFNTPDTAPRGPST